jgi:ABC-type Na+ transport system ATPase subunit NatA
VKKIVLRMSDLTLHNEDYGKLSYASFYTIEGEVTAFLGLNCSGKELLLFRF